MDPYDSPEEAAFREAARTFLAQHADPLPAHIVSPSAIVAEWTPDEEAERLAAATAWQRLKFDNGWAGLAWPSRYGGRDGSLVDEIIFRQEEREYDVPHDALIVGLGWCGRALLAHGSEEQRGRFVRPLLRGDEVWCQLFSEPGAGSDLAGLKTRAERDGEEWRLSGQKVWTTFAHHSNWGMCIARHDPNQQKHRGLTAFMIDMRSEGVTARPLRQMTDSANFNEVFLDDVVVPDSMRVGDVGDGWRVVITTFMWERVGVMGSARRMLEGLRTVMRERGVADDARARQRYADLHARAESLRFTGLRLLTALAQGRAPGPEGSTLKLAAATLLSDIYDLALDLLGPDGMAATVNAPWAGEWHKGFLGTPGLRIGGGTDAIQRNIIGERILGLPSDIRIDKDVAFADLPG